MNTSIGLNKQRKIRTAALLLLGIVVVVMAFVCLFVGSSHMSVADGFAALGHKGTNANIRIIWNIRIPRVLAAIIAGAGLSISGLIMQTSLNNAMASPSTLGVSNAAVFGANLSIIAFAGGFLSTGNNLSNFTVGANPYATSLVAFVFARFLQYKQARYPFSVDFAISQNFFECITFSKAIFVVGVLRMPFKSRILICNFRPLVSISIKNWRFCMIIS